MIWEWYKCRFSCVDRRSVFESLPSRRTGVRLRPIVSRVVLLVVLSLIFFNSARAQSPNGTISGLVLDSSHSVIAGAEITIVNDATHAQYFAKTNGDGVYVVSNLPPGSYRIQVAKVGFKTV